MGYTDLKRRDVRVSGGFWGAWRDKARDNGLMAVYDRFSETGRFSALDFAWKEGMPNKPHIFWDSDIAKWIEAAAYLLMDARDEKVEAIIDDCVGKIDAHRRADGYFNIYFDTVEPENRFTRYTDHELYDLGHLIEAAVAYYEATGKDRLLGIVKDYADLVDRVFRVEHSAGFDTPGHPEIEMALFRLYALTNEEKYLNLARYFIDARGRSERDNTYSVFGKRSYSQAHLPVREQFTAEGHSVRACYLYCAMADIAWNDGDAALLNACEKLFDNIALKRMYVTGGIGSSHVGEAFTFDYDLMNRTAYAETCASLALALFSRRMSRITPDGKYADIAEIALYNGMLAGVSLDCESFFYENPLEVQPDVIHFNEYYKEARDHMPIMRRKRVFDCSCCPPNVLRLIGEIGDFALTQSENAVYVHHFMQCEADTAFGALKMTTEYPFEGVVRITPPEGKYRLHIRVPGWAKVWRISVNGEIISPNVEKGYAFVGGAWAAGDEIALEIDMKPRFIQAHPALHEDCGRVAVSKGPLIYCMEECDNGKYLKDIRLTGGEGSEKWDEELGAPALDMPASRRVWPEPAPLYMDYAEARREDITARFIPYYAWANRAEGEMLVWTDIV